LIRVTSPHRTIAPRASHSQGRRSCSLSGFADLVIQGVDLSGQVIAPSAQHRRHAGAADLVDDLVERLGREAPAVFERREALALDRGRGHCGHATAGFGATWRAARLRARAFLSFDLSLAISWSRLFTASALARR
jgi:hypothetical protein